MQIAHDLPQPVRSIETVWIPMPDGCRLAARLWLPASAEREPVPAVLDFNPYRRRDHTRRSDSRIMPYIAAHGYACLRVDIRGSGDSDGVLEDEYQPLEQDDGLAILKWIAQQPWCTGAVGIQGISWGGFNGLQIASRRPPELKAVASLCSTDDRYADDVHYMGGCLLGDNLSWASVMFAYNSLPPDPEIVGEQRWRCMWKQRLEGSGLWLEKWLRHQRRDEYWKHGSVCEDYDAIEVPVLLASGWADGYSNSIFRLLRRLKVPCKGLIGPWSHTYPFFGIPGPGIGFLQELVRWWDQWLKRIDRGVESDPTLRVWMQHSVPPHPLYEHRPGRWVAEETWPSAHIVDRDYTLTTARLVPDHPDIPETPLSVSSPLSVGLFAGKWCSYAAPPDLPHDQRGDDGGSLIFDTLPLQQRVEVLGAPRLELELSSNKPVAMVALRLSDVAQSGEATRVTYGLLNLTHRHDHESPQPLVPGKRYRVEVSLNHVAQQFPAGHRIRLSISTSYFPLAWTSPSQATITVYGGSSRIWLPCRAPRTSDDQLRAFGPPLIARPEDVTVLEPPRHRWMVRRDLAADVSALEVVKDDGIVEIDATGTQIQAKTTEVYGHRNGDYATVRGEVKSTWSLRRGSWSVRTQMRTVLTSDIGKFHVRASLDAYENEERVHTNNYVFAIPREEV